MITAVNSSRLQERDTGLCQGKLRGEENCSHQEGQAAFWMGNPFRLESPLVFHKEPGSRFLWKSDELGGWGEGEWGGRVGEEGAGTAAANM